MKLKRLRIEIEPTPYEAARGEDKTRHVRLTVWADGEQFETQALLAVDDFTTTFDRVMDNMCWQVKDYIQRLAGRSNATD